MLFIVVLRKQDRDRGLSKLPIQRDFAGHFPPLLAIEGHFKHPGNTRNGLWNNKYYIFEILNSHTNPKPLYFRTPWPTVNSMCSTGTSWMIRRSPTRVAPFRTSAVRWDYHSSPSVLPNTFMTHLLFLHNNLCITNKNWWNSARHYITLSIKCNISHVCS